MRFRLARFVPVSLVTLGIGLLSALVPKAFAQAPAELLLQAVVVTGSAQEFIAIYNPNSVAVDLSNYYLTDGFHLPNGTSYINIVNPSAGPVGGGNNTDFHIRFPAGAMIAPLDTIAVGHQGSPSFVTSYGRKPAFEVAYASSNDPTVPDMRPAAEGTIPATPAEAVLSNSGESLVLYYWDGASDKVIDIDYVVWGSPPASYVVDKTGQAKDGPDEGTETTAYAPDTSPASQDSVASTHLPGNGFRREDFSEGLEVATGGNGINGQDETSENFSTTWSSTNPASPPFVKTGGGTPAVLTARHNGPYSGTVGTPITFNGNTSTPAQGETITGYAWNFGDGMTGTGATTTHAYAAAGTYTVTLTVTGSGGGTNTAASTTATVTGGGGGGGGTAAKLLFQAVVVTNSDQEFMAIYNPTSAAVDLSNYYITDAIFNGSPPNIYAYIVNTAAGNAGGGANSDFHLRFPAGAMIAAGDTIAIAHQSAPVFMTTYGRKPAFEVNYTASNDPTVPDMLPAFPGSIPADRTGATLSNGAESVVLYYWDQASDVVIDVDYVLWGSNPNFIVDKSAISVDGPDSDSAPTAYKADTPAASQQPVVVPASGQSAHANGNGMRRENFSEGTQRTTGGNGIGGRDETSENLDDTWSTSNPAVPPFLKTGGGTPTVLTARPGGPYTGTINVPISFNGSTSIPAEDETIDVFAWNFGDGTTGTGATPTHAYTTAGTYTVTLTVTGSGGGTNSATTTATVTGGGGGGGGAATKLLFQSVAVTNSDQEYIAVYNPSSTTVDLSNYYITDAIFNGSPPNIYAYIVNTAAGNAGGGANSDFHLRFPAGATIAAGDTIAIAHQSAPVFIGTYGRKPAFEVSYSASNDPTVPDMRPAFEGSIPADRTGATLSNGAESVVLYHWDQSSDLVTDIDYLLWGTNANFIVNKTGLSVDGPDSDSSPTAYNPDTPAANQLGVVVPTGGSAHANGNAMRREDYSEGTQRTTGGNGVGGRDETSENMSATWSTGNSASPPFVKGTAPPPPGQLTAVPGGPYNGSPNSPVTFNGTASTPKTGETITSYAWNFGDGSTGTGATVTHTYLAAGDYTVTLTVTGSGGGTHVATTTARIGAVPSGPLQVQARTFLPTRSELFPIIVDPAGVGGDNVTLRIYDLEGRELKVLFDGELLSKRTFTWNGHDDELMIVPAGTYICHLEIRDDTGRVSNFTAPVVVARRLERN